MPIAPTTWPRWPVGATGSSSGRFKIMMTNTNSTMIAPA
jgi:hypothetical protein